MVTHNVSMMIIQAGAARKIMDAEAGMAHEALLAVQAGGRSAMAELRHTIGLLTVNADGDPAAPGKDLAPQPDLDRLDALVGRVRETGLNVELTVTGTPCQVSSGTGLAVYRVVQEALTNTTKHARGASATVTLTYEPRPCGSRSPIPAAARVPVRPEWAAMG
ncbi:sensor histidine kinase [Streptomyces composti]|uniref:sensor histidine kinase n=1 Tax=Streptomyces composti TaxID=2720025 RepID=UPI00359C8E66